MKNQVVAACLGQRTAGPVRQRVRVIGEVDAVGRALLAGHVRRRRAGDQVDALLLAATCCIARPEECGSAIGQHIDALVIDPFAGQRAGDVRLVLIVGLHDLDRPAEHRTAEILHRQLDRHAVAWTADVAIRAAHVAEQADLHRLRRALRAQDARHGQRRRGQCADDGTAGKFLHRFSRDEVGEVRRLWLGQRHHDSEDAIAYWY